jgi:hypothetical protein
MTQTLYVHTNKIYKNKLKKEPRNKIIEKLLKTTHKREVGYSGMHRDYKLK